MIQEEIEKAKQIFLPGNTWSKYIAEKLYIFPDYSAAMENPPSDPGSRSAEPCHPIDTLHVSALFLFFLLLEAASMEG